MTFQTRDLWMLALGLEGDAPPSTLQPRLPDGMHLRWTFDPVKGFPWYGYYLFRRPSGERRELICLSRYWSRQGSGAPGPDRIGVGFGELNSDQSLTFTEEFPPAGVVEVDLDHRRYLRYEAPPNEPIRWAEATIGFRKREGEAGGTPACAEFRRDKPSSVSNPFMRQGAQFTALDPTGHPLPRWRLVAVGGTVGWDSGYLTEIVLPCLASAVEIELAHFSKNAPKVIAVDDRGKVVDEASVSGTGVKSVVLKGQRIAKVEVDSREYDAVIVRVCWICGEGKGDRSGKDPVIHMTARWGGGVVGTTQVKGAPGSVKQVQLVADAIDEIEFSSGDAALIELCVVPVRQNLGQGWTTIQGFRYPLCLPVAHADYPCPGKPPTDAAAETMALDRISYGTPGPWAGARYNDVRGRLRRLVVGGPPPAGVTMSGRFEPIAGSPAPPPETGGAITQRRQRPLDLLLLGSLQPAIAQMLGLYYWDKTAVPGTPYDYLLIADHDGSLGGKSASALTWVASVFDFTFNDGVVIFNKVVAPTVPLAPPTDTRVYALPGATVAPSSGGAVLDATNNAGIVWNRRQIADVLEADAPVMYHAWGAALGNADTPAIPAPTDFRVLTADSPIPVGRSILSPPQIAPAPGDWPPFAMNFIDRGRPDGWYGYRISGIDIFGRHSLQSADAVWHQWAPAPDTRPWYYVDPPADRVIHPSAVRLLDKLPPPPPPGVEAFALDPADPNVLHDAAWQTWFNSLGAAEKISVIGLRVRWQWTIAQQRQAPDMREFRVYYEPAPLDTLRGRVTSIAAASATETDVVTDIANGQPADSFAGLQIRIGADSFSIVRSLAGTPLRVRVRNIGPTDDVRPSARTRCALPILPGHALFKDFSAAVAWQDRLLVIPYGSNVSLDGYGNRTYQIFMPVPASANRAGLPLTTTLDEPMSAAAIGVTAADDKQHTLDSRGDAARFGNESRIGGPATVFRVRREKPPAPAMPPDSAKLYASPADYHAQSYFTYRWLPAARLKVFTYRAMDDAVRQADLAQRPRPALLATDTQFFPDQAVEPAWTALKRTQVATELNALNGVNKADKAATRAAYDALSNDGLRVLAGLPGTEKVFVQLTPKALDPDEPDAGAPDGLRWRRIGPDVGAGSLAAGQRAYVDALDGRATNRYFYRYAYVDEVQNIGPLSLSSPPVWLPDVTPPVAPRITKVSAGDRQVTLEWASNREPDLAEYRVYRTRDVNASRDVRLMDWVHTVPVAAGDPSARPPTLSWTDAPVPGLKDLWYRIVALDRVSPDPKGGGGNVSDPTPAIRTRAYDITPPDGPAFVSVEWVRVDAAGGEHGWAVPVPAGAEWLASVLLTWAAAPADVKLLVQVKGDSDTAFNPASVWLAPGTTSYLHRNTRTFEGHTYRLKVVNGAGNVNDVYHPVVLAPVP